MRQSPIMPLMAGLVAAAIWGGMYVVSKVVLAVIPPFSLLSLRLVLGFLVLALIISLRREWGIGLKAALQCLGVGAIGYGLSLGCQFVGTHLSTASNAALITSATPLLIIPFAWLIVREVARPAQIIALVLAAAGVVIIIMANFNGNSAGSGLGDWLLLAAAVSWALYSVLVAKISRDIPVLVVTALALAGGLPSSLVLGAWEIQTIDFGAITPGIIMGILYLGLVATALAMFLWNYAFARISANSASVTFFAQPVVGSLLAIALLGDQPSWNFIIGGILVGLAIAVQGYKGKRIA